jgi:hypothetical protein
LDGCQQQQFTSVPDGHLIEFLTMLDDMHRRPDLGIVSWSDWIGHNKWIMEASPMP